MIFGRSYSLWVTAATAVLNAAVAVNLVTFTTQQVGILDTALAAVILLLANADIKTALYKTPPRD